MAIRYPVKLGRRPPIPIMYPANFPGAPPIPLVYPANLAGAPWRPRQTWPAPLGALPSFLPSREEKAPAGAGKFCQVPGKLGRHPLVPWPAPLGALTSFSPPFPRVKTRKRGNDTESTTDPILATPRPARQNAPPPHQSPLPPPCKITSPAIHLAHQTQ